MSRQEEYAEERRKAADKVRKFIDRQETDILKAVREYLPASRVEVILGQETLRVNVVIHKDSELSESSARMACAEMPAQLDRKKAGWSRWGTDAEPLNCVVVNIKTGNEIYTGELSREEGIKFGTPVVTKRRCNNGM